MTRENWESFGLETFHCIDRRVKEKDNEDEKTKERGREGVGKR